VLGAAGWVRTTEEAWNDGTPLTVGSKRRRQPSAGWYQSAAAEQEQSGGQSSVQSQLGCESGDQRSTVPINDQ
jgi:hypothetical protein